MRHDDGMPKQPPGESSAGPAATPTPARDRATLWLPLLRRLTEAYPGWALLKNADSALLGTGDVDSLAAVRDWRGIAGEFGAWAREQGLGPVLACQHVGHGPNLVTLDPGRPLLLHAPRRRGRRGRPARQGGGAPAGGGPGGRPPGGARVLRARRDRCSRASRPPSRTAGTGAPWRPSKRGSR